jgi:uncharacterized protein (TIGR02757 family)
MEEASPVSAIILKRKMENCLATSRNHFDDFYKRYNRREFVHPDPLEFLYRYENIADREIAGLVASSLAYGKVKQILVNVEKVLAALGDNPSQFLRERASLRSLESKLSGFKHRFTTGGEVFLLLRGAFNAIKEYGSLNECFLQGLDKNDETVFPSLIRFVENLSREGRPASLLPLPEKGSSCKRLNLYLRWMVRTDAVDPGGWEDVSPSKLVIPLDTHMHRVCRGLYLTQRKQADMRTALEITARFREINPLDPVKYDFSLTRPGIMNDRVLRDCLKEHFKLEGVYT